MKDVVILGGGIAGLSAAWRLRHWEIAVLEAGDRVGGRIRSERRGPYWLNWGGHVYAGGNSATSWLLNNTGVDAVPIPGSLTGMAMNGKLLTTGPVWSYPFRIPMSVRSRLGILKAGAKVGLSVARYARIVNLRPGEDEATRQQRVYSFMNDRSFSDFVGELSADVEALFKPTVIRSGADLNEISAGAGVGYFSLVWGIGSGLTYSIVGGPSTLTQSIGAALGVRLHLGAAAREIVHKKDSVVVRYEQDGVPREIEARCVVLATQADAACKIAVDLDQDIRDALSKIIYGPFVSAAFLTNEAERQAWDGSYAIATPKRSFNVLVNTSNVIRGYEAERQPGSSLMVFSPASLARRLIDSDDAEIRSTYLADLEGLFPDFSGKVVESVVQRWPSGGPYCFPGRAKLQPALTRRSGRVFLAGDYLGTLYTETAIGTGLRAAQEAQSLLATERQRTTACNATISSRLSAC